MNYLMKSVGTPAPHLEGYSRSSTSLFMGNAYKESKLYVTANIKYGSDVTISYSLDVVVGGGCLLVETVKECFNFVITKEF